MDFAIPLAAVEPDRNWQRATGAALVLFLHLVLLLAALRAIMPPGARPRLEHELTFVLPPLPKPSPAIKTPPISAAPPPRTITLPPPVLPVSPAPLTTPDIKALGHSLFDCAPENLGNLSPEQRARCGIGFAPGDGTAVSEPRSHVKNPELRAAEMEKKNTPMNVPCVSIETRALGNAAQEQIVMVDPVCAAKEMRK